MSPSKGGPGFRPWWLSLWLVLAVSAVGCSQPAAARVEGDGWIATLTWYPQRVHALQPVRLILNVRDRAGRPVDMEGLEVRADMPDMSHKPDVLPFYRTGPGTYEATHSFSMDGLWRVRVTGRLAAGRLDATFTLSVGGP